MFWLASYPKSGNTWLRVFFTNLFNQEQEPANINQLLKTYLANDNHLIEHYTLFEPSELTFSELQNVRRKLYKVLPNHMMEQSCVKVHQANQSIEDNRPILEDQQQKVVYICRNPLDVVVSLAHHKQWDIDQTIDFLNDDKAILGSQQFSNQRLSAEYISSWSKHYESWKQSIGQLHLIRYEDMITNGLDTFFLLTQYLELPYTKNEIAEAMRKSEIGVLQAQEAQQRFKEGSLANKNFFRKGRAGDWEKVLSKPQIDRIISKHAAIMKELDYL